MVPEKKRSGVAIVLLPFSLILIAVWRALSVCSSLLNTALDRVLGVVGELIRSLWDFPVRQWLNPINKPIGRASRRYKAWGKIHPGLFLNINIAAAGVACYFTMALQSGSWGVFPLMWLLFAPVVLWSGFAHHHRTFFVYAALIPFIFLREQVDGLQFGQWFHHEVPHALEIGSLILGYPVISMAIQRSQTFQFLFQRLKDGTEGLTQFLWMMSIGSAFCDNTLIGILGSMIMRTVIVAGMIVPIVVGVVAAANVGGAPSPYGDVTTIMGAIHYQNNSIALHALPACIVYGMVVFPRMAKLQQEVSPLLKSTSQVTMHWGYFAWGWGTITSIVTCAFMAIPIWKPLWLGVLAGFVVGAIWRLSKGKPDPLEVEGDTSSFSAEEEGHHHNSGGAIARWREAFSRSNDRLIEALGLKLPYWIPWPRKHEDRKEFRGSCEGALFIFGILLLASLLPLPTTLVLGAVMLMVIGLMSAFVDNIPLMALVLRIGGVDGGFACLAAGIGGSLLPNGSSAGVGAGSIVGEAKDMRLWLKYIKPVFLGTIVAWLFYLVVPGYHIDPDPPPRNATGIEQPATPHEHR